jgi:hypothetical protein
MKKLGLALVVALLVAVFLVPAASAQSITWTSGFQVQNLSTSTASIVVSYYNQDGSKNIPDVSDTISGMGSKTYFPISANSGFNGSVVVSSDQPIVAIANTLGNSPKYAASTEGFSEGSNSVKLPLIIKGNAGYYTWFNVQNAGSAAASVTVQYVPGSAGNAYTAPAVTVQPGAAATFNQRDLANLGAKFVGSAVVTSDQPVVATVMQVGETYTNMMGYNGFTEGSTAVSLPLVMANNGGYYTGVQVQNVGSASATVTVDYGNNIAGSFAPANETATLAPNESATFLQAGGQWGSNKYVGSATITCPQPIVAIANQVKLGAPGGVSLGTAYNGFDASKATNKISAPLIMANNSGYYTGVQVQNVGTSAVNITIEYGPNTGGSYSPASATATIQPGNSYNAIQNGGAWTGNKYVGSMTVTAANSSDKIVMIVNQIWPAAQGDQFMSYNGFNY